MNVDKQNILEELLLLPYANYDNIRHQLMVRCPFCGDSVKHHDSTHFGIKINPSDIKEPILFHCFRCNIGGFMDSRTMRLLGSYNMEVNNSLYEINRNATRLNGKSLSMNDSLIKMKIPEVVINERSLKKHEYIEKRLGLKLDINDLAQKKVIYNFGNLLKENNFNKVNCSAEMAKMLQEDYVGFLSAKNEYINFRDTGNNKMRWYIYNVAGRIDNTRKFYIMPNKIDLFTKDMIIINICEGAFDALGIYYHIFDKESTEMLYVAACGAGFLSVLKYIIGMGITCNVDINIFSDADRGPGFYKKLYKKLNPWVNNINLYYNRKSKDYGVTKNEIELIKKRI